MSLDKWPSGLRQRFTKPPKALDVFRGFESYFVRFMNKAFKDIVYSTKIENNSSNEDYFFIIPPEIVDKLGWNEGTEVDVSVNESKIIINKIK